MFVSETHLIVRYAETDQMGIVHHSHYPVWFEAARTDFIKKMGMPYSKIEEEGAMLPLLELKCCYKEAARYEDEIIIKTQIKEFTPLRLLFLYEAYKNGLPRVIATGETLHVWTDKALKPVNIKKYSHHIYELLQRAVAV